ncbi:MAG TPA: tRNA lysidine(34) synthetase TilS [Chthoniobacterales bacterium]|nr:tRNA lysidine(34) synthetase TilS [Chthoniobacterales bacterium]
MTKSLPSSVSVDPYFLEQFPLKRRYLVGVSGGRDSVVLVHWLQSAGFEKLIVCHLDHRLRGRASAADARFVARLADSLGYELTGAAVNVRALAAKYKRSLETAAREARFQFFAKVAKARRCRIIFLGHHADDLVETFLLNLFRGAGMAGLGGIRQTSVHRVGPIELTIARPLLGVWRSEIDDYVHNHRLHFREDASNRDLTPRRNRVRHRLIPNLEKIFGRDVRRNIWRAAMIAAEENAWMDEMIGSEVEAELSVRKLTTESMAGQRRILQRWLRRGDVPDVGYDLIERVRALLDPARGVAKTNLPGARHVRRRAGKLFIE